ncbi:hypothetical protein SAMN05421738_104220 [Algoriella xinjiangensis]|uniref:PH domain-containing protein n=1 Tax=Algoriella xinjiangensis TaxID=684065 RepID=A0A1I4V107_9FLAO|nr:hypothetical protein [Algoriella xinjiangensis]SFM94959.1 hypothetical protein SAMN05421738_104220 [Algoriella xinjiangensis]VDH18054.1 Uncharacterised protein [Algoriella xinjiangensis]
MEKIIQININKYLILFGSIIFILFVIGLFIFDDRTLVEVSLIFYITIVLVSLLIIESMYTKVILSENGILKKTLFTKKYYSFEEISSIDIYKNRRFIQINKNQNFITIGWDYSDYNLFKTNLITTVRKNNIKINNRDKWWD